MLQTELLAECELDLRQSLESDTPVIVEEYLISLNQPAARSLPGGSMVGHFSVVSEHQAESKPVGFGRGEPNCTPVLEPVTQNRSIFEESPFAKFAIGTTEGVSIFPHSFVSKLFLSD